MWTYCQSTGRLSHGDLLAATGYSGNGAGKNNPAMQADVGVGPIPCGRWVIVGPPQNTDTHGPYVLRLIPEADTATFGRSGFLVHGDSLAAPGSASRGCIILPREVREAIWDSGDYHLTVIAEPPDAA